MNSSFANTAEQAGLTHPQARAYGSLIEIGSGTITDIAKNAEIKRSSVYNVISRLEDLGLVSKVLNGKRLYYSAAHPRRLVQLAHLKLNTLEAEMPKLVAAHQSTGEKPTVQMFEGIQAVRDVYLDIFDRLQDGEDLLIFTNIGRVLEKFPEIPKELKKILGSALYRSKTRELVYGDEAGLSYSTEMASKVGNGYQVRATSEEFEFGKNEQFILKDKIIYFALQKHIFVTIIENKDLAKTQRAMFDMAWEYADNKNS